MLTTLFRVTSVYYVAPGNGLSSIAADRGVSLSAVEAANPRFSADWNLIFPRQRVNLPAPGTQSAPVQQG
jgi:LysM repeat protein